MKMVISLYLGLLMIWNRIKRSEPGKDWVLDLLTQRSESELLVFISSAMDTEMNSARQLAVKAINEFFGRPWAFEFTPASSEAANDTYLRKVEEADFVVWLVGSRTTQAVINEVHRCLGCKRRLLVFKLPASARDERTQVLLEEAGKVVKWKDVVDPLLLGSEIVSALSDEMIRSLRDPLGEARNRELARVLDRSIADCTESFSRLTMCEEVATELARDMNVGRVLDDLASGLYVLEGGQGSGKTLACHRFFQQAVERTLKDSSQPFPIFIHAADIGRDLWDTIDSRCQGYMDQGVQSVLAIVDAVDEQGFGRAQMLFQQMESYARGNPNATLVATTRSIPGLVHNGIGVPMPTLSERQVVELVAKVSGARSEAVQFWSWGESLRESSQFPLFAVMIGVWLRDNSETHGLSRHKLVEYLAQSSLAEGCGNSEETDMMLQILATKTITHGARVRPHEVTPRVAKQRQLVDSRLVRETNSAIDFDLPIFREWYASRAILEGTTSVEELDLDSDRWAVPLSIAAHSDNLPVAKAVMNHLASVNPSMAAEVLRGGEQARYWGGVDPTLPETAVGVGEEIRQAMGVWAEGLGPLFGVIGPVGPGGQVETLGVRLSGKWLGTSWYSGHDQLGAVVEFTDDYHPFRYDTDFELSKDWPKPVVANVPQTELWSWVVTKGYLVEELGEVLERQRLSYEAPDAVDELVWEFAQGIGRNIGQYQGPIEIGDVLERIHRLPVDPRTTFATGSNVYPWNEIEIVRDRLSGLLEGGQVTVSDPWPTGDLANSAGGAWSSYTDQRLVERTRDVYMAAMRIYQCMVERWFASFTDRLRLYQLMPVRLVGQLYRLDRGGTRFAWLSWYPVILPVGESSEVVFEAVAEQTGSPIPDDYVEEQGEAFGRMRQGDPERLVVFHTSSLLREWGSRPATSLGYQWLADELKGLGWVYR